ncbi:MAG: hypothetical protein JNM34_04745 [Chthonomonadaceae bacterium]|nr:hypothetical protein [Chthonomonadaceae bacterium]
MSFLKRLFGTPKITIQGMDIGELMQQAQQGQQAQTTDIGQLMAQATANMEALTGQKAEPRAQLVKKTNCHTCGAAKTLAPKTAYVYCDFCGSLTDYDFQKACENPQSAMPGPAYEQLIHETNADAQLARRTRDKEAFLAIQRRLFDRWVDLCPNAVSPRAKQDERYRKELVEYMAQTATINEFDETYQQYAAKVAEQVKGIAWEGMYPRVTARGDTFWPLYETVSQQLEHSYSILRPAGVLDLHPDGAPESLQRRMTMSMFCQGWLPTLGPADSEKMVERAGLKGEYSVLEPVETSTRHCGGCGGDLQSLPGSKVMLCEDCGTKIDVSSPEVNCKNCAGMISFPVGVNRLQCPYCKSEAQRMSW